MSVLALAGLADSWGSLQSTALIATGNPNVRLRLALARSVVTILGFLLVVRWGILAVAVSFLVTTAVAVPVMNSIAMKRLVGVPFRSQFTPHIVPVVGSAVMAMILLVAKGPMAAWDDRLALAAYVLLGAVTYTASISLLQPRLLRQAVNLLQAALPRQSLART
jgi:PST family polysaccharide transporter